MLPSCWAAPRVSARVAFRAKDRRSDSGRVLLHQYDCAGCYNHDSERDPHILFNLLIAYFTVSSM